MHKKKAGGLERKSAEEGKSVVVREDLGACRVIKKKKYIYKKCGDGAVQRNPYLPDGTQHDGTGERKSRTDIGRNHPFQISNTMGDNLSFLRVNSHNPFRRYDCYNCENGGKNCHKAKHNGNGFL